VQLAAKKKEMATRAGDGLECAGWIEEAKMGAAKDLANAVKGGLLVGGLLKVSSPLQD